MKPTRLAALLLLPAAFITFAAGLLLYAGAALPYPDPTPELLQDQALELRRAQAVMVVGLLVFCLDAVWLWRTRRRH